MKNKNNIICMATMIVATSLSFVGCGKGEITTENETEMSTVIQKHMVMAIIFLVQFQIFFRLVEDILKTGYMMKMEI